MSFTTPSDGTFLQKIDEELIDSKDPDKIGRKYPWINDGYDGPKKGAIKYFEERLVLLESEEPSELPASSIVEKRELLSNELKLGKDQIEALDLARNLAKFMDERKMWMMKTRSLITEVLSDIQHGWLYNDGETLRVDLDDTKELWERYVNFKTSSNAVSGIVASNANKHFVNGEVFIVSDPTANFPKGKILVTPSTSPSYVPLMRNAKALITDHGGMMSHAAIVSREFNLPCIVGTKQATKILKNGDKVVLHLVTGEVIR